MIQINQFQTPLREPWQEPELRVTGHEDCARCGGYGFNEWGGEMVPCPTGLLKEIEVRDVVIALVILACSYIVIFGVLGVGGGL